MDPFMRGALVRSADAFFANCPLGLDLRQADFSGSGGLSLSIFEENGEGDRCVPVGGRAGWGLPIIAPFLVKLALSLSKGAPVSERRRRLFFLVFCQSRQGA
jgi:hypothetical protein